MAAASSTAMQLALLAVVGDPWPSRPPSQGGTRCSCHALKEEGGQVGQGLATEDVPAAAMLHGRTVCCVAHRKRLHSMQHEKRWTALKRAWHACHDAEGAHACSSQALPLREQISRAFPCSRKHPSQNGPWESTAAATWIATCPATCENEQRTIAVERRCVAPPIWSTSFPTPPLSGHNFF